MSRINSYRLRVDINCQNVLYKKILLGHFPVFLPSRTPFFERLFLSVFNLALALRVRLKKTRSSSTAPPVIFRTRVTLASTLRPFGPPLSTDEDRPNDEWMEPPLKAATLVISVTIYTLHRSLRATM